MKLQSYQEVNQEIEIFNKDLAEATFHGQIEVFYVEKFDDPSALFKELSDEYGSKLSDLGKLKKIFNDADLEDEIRSINELSGRKDELMRGFDTLIKGHVIRIFRSDGRRQIGDELSFKLQAKFASFISYGGQPVCVYETLCDSKFMEILLKDTLPAEKFIIKRFPTLTTHIEEPTNTPFIEEIVSELAELNQPRVLRNFNKMIADTGLHIQIEIIERIKSFNNSYDLITGRIIRIFLNDETIQIGDEVNFEAWEEFNKVASGAGEDISHKITSEKKYMEVLFTKEQPVNKVTKPTQINLIKEPTTQPVLFKKDSLPEPLKIELPPEPPKLRRYIRCGHPLTFSKFCSLCGLTVSKP
jgi:hypothetical protein